MVIPPQLILGLFTTFAPIVRKLIEDFRTKNDGRMPTDEEMLAEFNANADRILAEGEAWRASHPENPNV